MSTVNDIPERDKQDGTKQLQLLRSYLKDITGDMYTDATLVALLIEKDKIGVWRDLTGYTKAIPWSYDLQKVSIPVNRIRLLIDDTTEESLKYTDYELLRLLEVLPLRYVISIIKAKAADGETFPKDPNDPLHILRKYLEDEKGVKYTDKDLVNIILESGLDPFGIILGIIDKNLGASTTASLLKSEGGFASLDGISFSSSVQETEQSKYNRDFIAEQSLKSIYVKDPVYGMYRDGTNIAVTAWEEGWYAL